MASTISRVTALTGILGVNARQVCRFKAKIWLPYAYKFYHYNTSVISNNYIITVVSQWLDTLKKQRILIFIKKQKKKTTTCFLCLPLLLILQYFFSLYWFKMLLLLLLLFAIFGINNFTCNFLKGYTGSHCQTGVSP